MPWHVEKRGNRWAIIKSSTGEVVGYSDSEEKAQASVRARYANSKDEAWAHAVHRAKTEAR